MSGVVDEIIKSKIETIKEEAYAEGYALGYAEGLAEARAEEVMAKAIEIIRKVTGLSEAEIVRLAAEKGLTVIP